jgi:dTDP-4-dehydrorhamnose 3,5-epimerase
MEFIATAIPEVLLIKPEVHGDGRGFFMETYHASDFAAAGIEARFVQDNHSGSRQGTLRGLHYQIRQSQAKLVRVVVGQLFDVAVDIRRSSPTFGKWVGCTLSAENRLQMFIPVGFAHGFFVLSAWSEVLYKTTDFYAPRWERSIRWNDPEIGIQWPLSEAQAPILSAKDTQGNWLSQAELFD